MTTENKKDLTPEKEAEEWLVKVREYEKTDDYEDWCFWKKERDGTSFIYLTELLSNHDIFVDEVVKVMEGFVYAYSILDTFVDSEYGVWFVWGKPESEDPNEPESDVYYEKIIDHNWPLAAIKAAKQTPEIQKIMEEYDAKH